MHSPLEDLRQAMRETQVDACYLPTADFHDSEYAGPHFTARRHFSGFNGSAGTLVVLQDWAGLWTDGRYFLQAERQLAGSGIALMKQGQPGVPTIEAALSERLSDGQCFGFDGRCVNAKTAARLRQTLSQKGIKLRSDIDLAGLAWPDRPPLSARPVWELPLQYAGASREEKLTALREDMAKEKADALLLTALDDTAWLLNLRGDDVPCTPVFLAFFLLEAEKATLFVNETILSAELQALLAKAGVSLAPYDAVYEAVAALPKTARVLLDRSRVNARLDELIPGEKLDRRSPVVLRKAVKNDTEQKNVRIAHLKDGIAMTKLMYRLKTGPLPPTELDIAAEVEALREAQEHYVEPSFAPIVAYGPNAAIVHYAASAKRGQNADVRPEGFLMIDSGGHYLEGSTDCTRTFALGPLTAAQKQHYTAVLRGNLTLAAARFPKGCTGHQLDALARKPLWQLGLDFNHGTGHGVGYLLGVHEGPQSIRSRSTGQDVPLAPGMITSDEPALYFKGEYGIRLENLLLCVESEATAFGSFLAFETLTLIPFDRDAIAVEEMNSEEVQLLNAYHRRVYEEISPHLSADEVRWLAEATAPLAAQ